MSYKTSPWIALFTDASAGLCPEFMNIIYSNPRYKEIREVWLIDRKLDSMQAIADCFPGKKIRMIVLDVADPQQIKDFSVLLKTYDPYIRLMINNSSRECIGDFSTYSFEDTESLLNISTAAPVLLLKVCQPYIQIGSVIVMFSSAGHIPPLSGNSIFGSAKRFCYFFSLSLFYEFHLDGIRIMAACPGHMDDMRLLNRQRQAFHLNPLSVMDRQLLAINILKNAENWKVSYTPGIFFKLYIFFSRFLPINILVRNSCRFY